MIRRLALLAVLASTATVVAAAPAQAVVTPDCDVPNSLLTLAVTGTAPADIEVLAGPSVVVDTVPVVCAGIARLLITGNNTVNNITLDVQAAGLDIDAALSSGADVFVATGPEAVDDIAGENGEDQLTAPAGGGELIGGTGNDTLTGRGASDTLNGGDDNDTLIPGPGGGTNIGGDGADTVSWEALADGVTANLGLLIATVSGVNQTLLEIENLRGGPGGDDFTGDTADNELSGGGGADALDGAGGDDQLDGGDMADTLVGGVGADSLSGGTGNDLLQPGTHGGANTGGDGEDTVTYADLAVAITAFLDGNAIGIGVAQSLSQVENLVGGAAGDSLTGNVGPNKLTGNDGLDTLIGLGGADTLSGGDGDDTLRPGAGTGDTIAGGLDVDTVSYADVTVSVSAMVNGPVTGLGISHTITTSENLVGGSDGDTLRGNDQNNRLDGGEQSDTLIGGLGNDMLAGGVDTGPPDVDTVSYADRGPAAGVSAVLVGHTSGNGGQPGIGENDLFDRIENLRGGAGPDTLIGGDLVDTIDGAEGDDTIWGGDPGNTLIGGDGTDTLTYQDHPTGVNATLGGPLGVAATDNASEFERLIGSAGADLLVGNDNDANVITGGDDDDIIHGLGGTDSLVGGRGSDFIRPGLGGGAASGGGGPAAELPTDIDTVSYSDVASGVDARLGANTATVGGSTQSLFTFENLSGGGGADVLFGNNGANLIRGAAGNDTLVGAGGDDQLFGDADSDTVSYEERGNPVGASLATGTGGTAAVDSDTFDSIENLRGGAGGDTLIGAGTPGAPVVNRIEGLDGNDFIADAGDAGDTLVGGLGTDDVSYATAAVAVVIDLGGASGLVTTDTVTEVENAQGGSGNDTIWGTTGANNLLGGIGNDTIVPGLGGGVNNAGAIADTDTISYENLTVAVSARLDTGQADIASSPAANQTILNFDVIIGGSANDTLRGNSASNLLEGRGGDDTLIGELGNDVLHGDDGSDTVSYDLRPAAVSAALTAGGGGSGGQAGEFDSYTDVENLTGGSGADVLRGSLTTVNRLDGALGNDTIFGGADDDPDTLIGGGGTDLLSYNGEATGVVVDLSGAEPTPPDPTDIASEFENVIGGTGDDRITGNDSNNVLTGGMGLDTLKGNAGNDAITGGDGNDTITGGDGNDTLTGDDEDDTIDGGAGNDTVDGSDNDDILTGGEGDDVVRGSDDDDAVDGGMGNDRLTGGNDDDTLTGGDGEDVLDGGVDRDALSGGAGADALAGGLGPDSVTYAGVTDPVTVTLDGQPNDGGAAEGDNVVSTEEVFGGDGADTLVGDQAVNQLRGGPGADVLDGAGNDDVLDGGADSDIASYAARPADNPVTASLDGLNGSAGGANEADVLTGIEGVRGGDGDDALIGAAGDQAFEGGGGDDALTGGDGADALSGGAGSDVLLAGPGDDRLLGGDGGDRLDGGIGLDDFSGDNGDDDINSFDALGGEVVRCGDGADLAAHDASDTFPTADCEFKRIPSAAELPFIPAVVVAARDRDADGSDSSADCNDTNAAVRPGAPEVPANGIDENCDGADAPVPQIASTLSTSFQRTKRGLRIRRLELRNLPAGAEVEVRCRSRRSPRCVFSVRRRTIPAERARLSLRGFFGDRPLSAGTVIEVRLTVSGSIGQVVTLTVPARGNKPTRAQLCLPPGARNGVRC